MSQKLQPLNDWRRDNFTRPPSPKTARSWCENQNIPAKQINGRWFVIINNTQPEVKSKALSLVDKVLNK